MGSPISGAPAAISDIFTGNFEIYYNEGGDLTEDAYVTNSRTWTGPKVLAGGISGTPSVVGFPYAGQLQVFWNHGGSLYQDVFTPGKGFSGPQAVGTSVIGSPVAIPFGSLGCMDTFYEDTDPARGGVTDLATDSWCANSGWSGAVDLTTTVTGLTGPAVPAVLSQSGVTDGGFVSGEEVYFQSGNYLVEWLGI